MSDLLSLLPLSASPCPPVSASPLPASAQWLTVAAAAQLLGKTERTIQRICGEQWLAEGKARTVRQPGCKPCWQVRSDADPALSRLEALAQPASAVQPVDPDAFKQFPAKARTIAMARSVMLLAWNKYLVAGAAMNLTRDEATDRFLFSQAHPAPGTPAPACGIPGRSTLYVWAERHKEEGLLGLVPGWSRRAKETQTTKEADSFLEAVKRFWLDQRKRSIKTCYEMAMAEADRLGWTYRSYNMAKRYLAALAPQTVTLLREGPEAFNNDHAPYLNGDYSTLQSNEIWNADHHQFDVIVKIGEKLNPATGEKVPVYTRPWLSAWQDLRSRKLVGWIIRASDPNTDAITEALDVAMETHDCPQCAYTDNGKDFDAWALTGVTKAMRKRGGWARRKLHVQHDQQALGGIYGAFGIKHIHAWPFHGQSKPIERFFGRMEDQFGRLWATYCGRNPQEKPEDLPQQLARGNAPTLEEFTEAFGHWVETSYHKEAHRGDAMDDKAPETVWEENLVTRRVCPPELRRLLLQKRIGRWVTVEENGQKQRKMEPLTVGQNGVVCHKVWYGQYDLASHHGKKVFLRTDRSDISRVGVYAAADDTFLCWATANLKVPRNATHQDLSAAIKVKQERTLAMKEGARARLRIHEDLVDIMLSAAQRKAALAAPVATDPIPPSIQPVRSALEGQLPEIQRQLVPLKKAVGDDTPARPQFQYPGAGNTESDGGSSSPRFIYHGRSSPGDSHE